MYGVSVTDTQTGLRGISWDLLSHMCQLSGERFEYEMNMLTDAALSKTPVHTLEISTVYLDNNSESHFNPLVDSIKIYRILFGTFLKYAVLLVMVFLLPALMKGDTGIGDPYFCKYLCPQGVLEGAIPLSLANAGIRAALGKLFTWKLCVLISVVVLSVLFYRPFCKWLCPLGAFYALLNKVSLFQMKVDGNKCVSCGKCARACKMDVDVTKTPNHTECIRCGMCIRACPTNAVCFRYGFGDGKEKENAATLRENNNKA